MSTRIIMHIDMNSYFASCEQQDNPAWRGQPLGVCEHLGGIIIAPSVEAKRWGVKTGTPVWEAKVLCPQIILTRASPDRYRFYTAKFYTLLEEYTGLLERYSIDEAFLDLTKACNIRTHHLVDPFQEAGRIAQEIKQRIKLEVGDWLRCSVGVGWNKLVAKIASDLQKPDGLVVVRPEEKHLLYERLKLTDIPGIASRQARRLLKYGIRTLIDLKNCPESHLVSWFGIPGRHLWFMGQLEGFYGEEFSWQPLKSIGHMYTIAREQRKSPVVAQNVLARLAEFVARRLRSLAFAATHISVMLIDTDSQVLYGHVRMGDGVALGSEILSAGHLIIQRAGGWPKEVVRVGLTAFGLRPQLLQMELFSQNTKNHRLALAMDAVNTKHSGSYDWKFAKTSASLGNAPSFRGQDVLLPAPAFFARKIIRDSIGFGRLREMGAQDP